MSEIEISSSIIIDDVDEVQKHLSRHLALADGFAVNLEKVVDFIKTQEKTRIYMDTKMSMRMECEKPEYLWLDTGLVNKNGNALFVSLWCQAGLYVGHVVADYTYLSTLISSRYARNRRSIATNKGYFRGKYEKLIAHRELKHLSKEDVVIVASEVKPIAEERPTQPGRGAVKDLLDDEAWAMEPLVNVSDRKPAQQEDTALMDDDLIDEDVFGDGFWVDGEIDGDLDGEDYGQEAVTSAAGKQTFERTRKSIITDQVQEMLMFNNWKTQYGLDRYLKVCGARLLQLIENNSKEYYLYDGGEYAVINTGLLDRFGRDILVTYKATGRGDYKFSPLEVVESKQRIIKRGFSKADANKELKPIQFFDEGKSHVFYGDMEDFDISNKALMHIIDARRERFPDAKESDSYLAQKVIDAIERGVKMQQRDSSYIKATYSAKQKAVAWVFPLHIDKPLTEAPELAVIVRENDEFYGLCTIIKYDDNLRDRLTCMALYSR